MSPAVDREGSKWDRAARLLRVATVLHAHPAGISAQAIADQIGVSKRTVYRDLQAHGVRCPSCPSGRTVASGDSIRASSCRRSRSPCRRRPPSSWRRRVLAKATDEHDSELLSAYVKLAEILPPVLAEHLHATVDAYAGDAPERAVHARPAGAHQGLGRAAGGRDHAMGRACTRRTSRRGSRGSGRYAIEPSALTRALYLIGVR